MQGIGENERKRCRVPEHPCMLARCSAALLRHRRPASVESKWTLMGAPCPAGSGNGAVWGAETVREKLSQEDLKTRKIKQVPALHVCPLKTFCGWTPRICTWCFQFKLLFTNFGYVPDLFSKIFTLCSQPCEVSKCVNNLNYFCLISTVWYDSHLPVLFAWFMKVCFLGIASVFTKGEFFLIVINFVILLPALSSRPWLGGALLQLFNFRHALKSS